MKSKHEVKKVLADVVKAEEVSTPAEQPTKVGFKFPTNIVIKRDIAMKIAVGIVAALILVPVLDWLIQTSITSQYAAFYKNSDVTRSVYMKELEKQYGNEVMQELLAKAAIKQGAKDKDIEVSEEDITAAVEADKTRAGITSDEDFKTALAQSNLTEAEYREFVRTTVTLDKLIEGGVAEPTEAELKEYFTTNKELYSGSKYEDVKETIKAEIQQMDLNTKRQAWIDAALKDYDPANNLVTAGNAKYGFLKSIELVDRLFSGNPSAN
jgi:hypothetical protein